MTSQLLSLPVLLELTKRQGREKNQHHAPSGSFFFAINPL